MQSRMAWLLVLLLAASAQAQQNSFRFIVFGDFNGGGCTRNARVQQLINQAASELDIAFYVSTGDLIDGYRENGRITSCFSTDPASIDPTSTCDNAPNGNVKSMLSPILDRTPLMGLAASFYPVLGNHDDNWGSGWYPDLCGDGICDLYDQDGGTPEFTLLNRYITDRSPGAVCSLDQASSDYPTYFYYRFDYGNSLFLMLRINNDYGNMLSCNNLPASHASCAEYCTDPTLFNDPTRNSNCYSVHQYDWLRQQLEQAQGQYEHIFVFAHAPLLGSGDNHGPTSEAPQLRALLEQYNTRIYFNGHNHAYERSHPVRGNQVDNTGTVYLTVGVAGAFTDGNDGNQWFDAASYHNWASYGEDDKMATYTIVTVNGSNISLETKSLGLNWQVVDSASYSQLDSGTDLIFSNGFEGQSPPSTAPVIAGCQIFPDDALWNTPIDTAPLHPDSDAYIASIGATTTLHPDFGTTWNGQDIGIPYNIVPQGQTRVPVQFTYWDESDLEADQCDTGNAQDTGCYPIPDNPAIEGAPVDAGDRHVLVLEQGSCKLYETFATTRASGNWQAGSGAIWDLSQKQNRPADWTSADAAGLAILPGLVRYEETMVDEQINHALRFTLDTIRSAYIPPATHSDGQGGCSTSLPAMGQRFRLKADYDISTFSPPIQAILRAMKKYGIVLADTGSDMFISGQHHDNWDDDLLRELRQVTAGDFEAVYTGDAVGYGSCP